MWEMYWLDSLLSHHEYRIKSSPVEEKYNFTDSNYQEQLPAHARSTASMVNDLLVILYND